MMKRPLWLGIVVAFCLAGSTAGWAGAASITIDVERSFLSNAG